MTAPRTLVLVIGPTPPPFHGVAVATRNLLTGDPDPRIEFLHLDIADRRGIEHVDRPDLHDVWLFIRQWLTLVWLLLRHRPQVVYLSISQRTIGFLRDSLFIAPARLLRRRIVIHLHGGNLVDWYRSRSWAMRMLIRRVLASATRFVILAEVFRQPLTALLAADRLVVVPNGIDLPAEGCSRGSTTSGYEILFLSTLSREKGALLLLEAFARVAQVRDDVRLVLAGPWARPADLEAALSIVSKHELDERVVFRGPVDGPDKAATFRSADLFVFPGLQQEGQPLVVLEALASGLPVVFPDRGCLRETVIDGESGVEFAVADATDLANKLLALLAEPLELARMAANARQRFEQQYSRGRFVGDMKRVFLDVAGVSA